MVTLPQTSLFGAACPHGDPSVRWEGPPCDEILTLTLMALVFLRMIDSWRGPVTECVWPSLVALLFCSSQASSSGEGGTSWCVSEEAVRGGGSLDTMLSLSTVPRE